MLSQIDQLTQALEISVLQLNILFVKQRGLELHLLGLFVELDKDSHLCFQGSRVQRLDQVVNRAESISFGKILFVGAVVCGQENDRNVTRFLAASNQLGSFQSAYTRHANIE